MADYTFPEEHIYGSGPTTDANGGITFPEEHIHGSPPAASPFDTLAAVGHWVEDLF